MSRQAPKAVRFDASELEAIEQARARGESFSACVRRLVVQRPTPPPLALGMGQALKSTRKEKVKRDGQGSARKAIDGFEKRKRVCGLTGGQFSLIDLLGAVLEITGPADVVLSTWTAGINDTEAAKRAEDMGQITSLRMLVDRSFMNRQPKYARRLLDLYGPDAVRTCRIHAKFIVITNAKWSVVIQTSMNLNMNRRIESYDVSESASMARVWLDLVNEIWETAEPGLGDKNAQTRDFIADRLGGSAESARDDKVEHEDLASWVLRG